MSNERSNKETTCQRCGRKIVPTGKTKLGRATTPVFDHADFRVRLVEYKCVFCGHEEWLDDDPGEPPQ